MSISEWVDGENTVCVRGTLYSPEGRGPATHPDRWPRGTVRGEGGQTEKDKRCMSPLVLGICSIEVEILFVVSRGQREVGG